MRFWERQFAGIPTRQQTVFDLLFGILAPITCLIFDPGIFRGGMLADSGVLGNFQWFAYFACIMQVFTLRSWLQVGEDFEGWLGAIAGILLAGAICAGLVGILILPLSLLGLFVLIGAFGFIPFLTAIVFARNAFRALRLAREHTSSSGFLGMLVLGMVIAIAVPAAPQLYAQYQRPEIETITPYPDAENMQVGEYTVTDSGSAEEKNITFDTVDTEEQVRGFYDQAFIASGWSHGSGDYDYTYDSASGRSYFMRLHYKSITARSSRITIHIKRLK
jgi:hypothetical protein